MKQTVAKSNVPSERETEGKRKVEFNDVELKSEFGINGKDEIIASEPLVATKKGDFLIDIFVVVVAVVVMVMVDDSPATVLVTGLNRR